VPAKSGVYGDHRVMRSAFLALLALVSFGACDDQAAAPAAPAAQPDAALQSAAERECATMTGYAPEKLATKSSEMRALVEREYKSCVAKVTTDKLP
jgi:hypothetical protein